MSDFLSISVDLYFQESLILERWVFGFHLNGDFGNGSYDSYFQSPNHVTTTHDRSSSSIKYTYFFGDFFF